MLISLMMTAFSSLNCSSSAYLCMGGVYAGRIAWRSLTPGRLMTVIDPVAARIAIRHHKRLPAHLYRCGSPPNMSATYSCCSQGCRRPAWSCWDWRQRPWEGARGGDGQDLSCRLKDYVDKYHPAKSLAASSRITCLLPAVTMGPCRHIKHQSRGSCRHSHDRSSHTPCAEKTPPGPHLENMEGLELDGA